ncbi:MAG: leucine--tRNA ligase [Candidatus Thermoplasmatota archaeon]|nr:leucine--tRNA ligase [Candidatus Thermoplasmatota archaeon]
MDYDHSIIEKKWQNVWYAQKANEARLPADKTKPKFFIHFAYPGISGYQHIGHMRGFTYSDVIARYKAMHSFNVIFPAGFHASGLPSVSLAKRVERNDQKMIKYLKDNGCPEETIPKLADPGFVVDFFSKVYEESWRSFGFFIDYSRQMTTISPGYNKFIQWQFLKLNEKNLLITKPHYAPYCPNCGPVAIDTSETDISRGGSAEVQEFTILKFKMADGTILPAATLRPETVFGVTNMWLNPEVEYVRAKVDGEQWILSQEAAGKIAHQGKKVEIAGTVKGTELIGKSVTVPLTNRTVPIFAGPFVDAEKATGVVMSVPAHAPYDWMALHDLGAPVEPIVIINIEGYKVPAKEICEAMGVASQKDAEKLDLATEEIYKKEFHTGILNERCVGYAGKRISEVKDTVKQELMDKGLGDVMREFSEPVVCRCGTPVVIKQIPDQWFIRYSDAQLTEKSKEWAAQMSIFPKQYYEEMPRVLDWFGDRACIRRGAWLGTKFPFKQDWIVEPISDSTLYPAYYTLAHFVNEGLLSPQEMTEQFFDYAFLGKGVPPAGKKALWDAVKSEFDYWYPVDINLGGKEHKTVHFPVFLMNHVAILPPKGWPKGLFVHWWVTQKGGEKISKSKGGAEPIPGAVSQYGADALRLYYVHIGSPFIDIEWDPEAAFRYRNRIEKIWRLVEKAASAPEGTPAQIDKWLISMMNRRIAAVEEAMKEYDLRRMANETIFALVDDIEWFLERGGTNRAVMRKAAEALVKTIAPITPHLAEECYALLGGKGIVSQSAYPAVDKSAIDESAESAEELVRSAIADISEILKVTGMKPKRLVLYTTPEWKAKVQAHVAENGKAADVGETIKWAMAQPELKQFAKDVPKFATKVIIDIKKLGDEGIAKLGKQVNEMAALSDAKATLSRKFECQVDVFSADDKGAYDPQGKSKNAAPGRPAIFVE